MNTAALNVAKFMVDAVGGGAVSRMAKTGLKSIARRTFKNRMVREFAIEAASLTIGMGTSACIDFSIDQLNNSYKTMKESFRKLEEQQTAKETEKKEAEKALSDPAVCENNSKTKESKN